MKKYTAIITFSILLLSTIYVLADSWSPGGKIAANTVLAGSNGGGAQAPAPRQIVNGDITNSTIDLTAKVTGALPVANGGTGLSSGTSGGVPYFSASNTIASSGALTANRLVLGGGAGAAPTVSGSLGTTTTVLHGNASGAPTFGAVSMTADVTGTLPIANGGTGATALTIRKLLLGNATSAIATSTPSFFFQDATPTADAADDIWYETDTNIWWYWNGTYWLSCQLYTVSNWIANKSGSDEFMYMPTLMLADTYNLYITDFATTFFVLTTNDGTNYWQSKLERRAANNAITVISTLDSSSGVSTSTWVTKRTASVGVHLDLNGGLDAPILAVDYVKVSAPGNLYAGVTISYRLAHP